MARTSKKRLTNQVLERMTPPKTGRLEARPCDCVARFLLLQLQTCRAAKTLFHINTGV